MKRKIVGILAITLLIATAVLPVVGTMNEADEYCTTHINQPTVEWMKTFDRGEFDHFHTVRQTDDGGYIACGDTEEDNMFYVWIVKVDSLGDEEWKVVNHDLNGSYLSNSEMYVAAFDIQQTVDGGFIISGISMIEVEIEGNYVWVPTGFLWKTDGSGNTDWVYHYYEITEYGVVYYPYAIIETDTGYVSSGMNLYYDITSAAIVNQNGLIFKTDLSGTLQWVEEFDKDGTDSLSSLCVTSDGGYFLGGFTDNENVNEGALWMVKTDGNGNKQWEKVFDGPGFEYTYGKGCCQTIDGGYIMNGVSNSYGYGGTDIWVIRTDSSGNQMWDNTFGADKNDYCWGMCKADDNGFVFGIVKDYGSFSGNKEDILIVETDENGNAEWQLQIEEEGTQVTRSIVSTNDGGYIVAAMTASFGNTRSDAVLAKISSFSNERPVKPAIDGPSKGKPGKEYTFTADSSDPDGGSLLYRWDWGDGNYSDWLSSADATYTWTYEDNFEIRVMTRDEHGGESEWSDALAFSTPRNKIEYLSMELFQRLYDLFPYFTLGP